MARTSVLRFLRAGTESPTTWLAILIGFLFRAAICLHPYSGAGKPPMYGDYEAQRHWMEITTNLPVSEWYAETKQNNLSYWGLDYPPLSAYQSWLYGKVIERLDPDAMALGESHGYESADSKRYMRQSVMISDLIVLVPALLACRRVFCRGSAEKGDLMLLGSLMQPALLLIDHGHFQYNSISLGLAAGAAAAVASGKDVLGSILFCLAMNHKQMAMFYAPAFFAHLLGRCLQKPSLSSKMAAIARLGLAVTATFVVVWAPFLANPSDALHVLHRIMPLKRGLYEDYVANFWCTTSMLVKWRSIFSQQALVWLCMGSTLLAAMPVLVQEVRRPTARGLLVCMASSAFAFYLFSYQVHEKSILLPLMPVMLLGPDQPIMTRWLPPVACFSMYPLLKKDGLTLAYIALMLLWGAMTWPAVGEERKERQTEASRDHVEAQVSERWRSLLLMGLYVSVGLAVGIHAAPLIWKAPKQYPYIFDALFTSFSFLHILGLAVYLQYQGLANKQLKGD
ncbi:g8012 [Coccomyxa viridis]|uniref:Alpha-1,3-glucosyltransferase n=1 Tax=Coccomyxa viridis TaxID=1274662 RepID=A0ABP1G1T5_9CHLO